MTNLALIVPSEKVCTKCKQEKSISDFYLDRGKPAAQCKPCRIHKSKEYTGKLAAGIKTARREKFKGVYGTNYNYKRFFGLDIEIVTKMLAAQDNECAVCSKELVIGGPDRAKRANLDHNHGTGKVRGLLCQACNMYVGVLENKNKILKAIGYLNKYDTIPEHLKRKH